MYNDIQYIYINININICAAHIAMACYGHIGYGDNDDGTMMRVRVEHGPGSG